MLRVVDEERGQRRWFYAPKSVHESVEEVEFAGVNEMPGQAVEDRRQGAEQRGVDAEERPLRSGLAVRSGRAQNQVVGT